MKIFQTVQANYKLLGISPTQSSHHFPYNPKIFLSFVNFGLSMASYIMYLIQVAENFKEYIECVTTLSALFIIVVCYGAVVFNIKGTFENIDGMEKVIKMRKSIPINSFYYEDFEITKLKTSFIFRIQISRISGFVQ